MTFTIGDEILNGKYRLEAELGQGGYGVVYRATHVVLQAPRALKVLRQAGVGSSGYARTRRRFELEAQLGALLKTLRAPHVVEVYDFEEPGDLLMLVMEYAPGGSLADRLAEARRAGERLPVAEALAVARETAMGLAALHALDAVHRDVKPSNLLFDARGQVLLADFGLAQVPWDPSGRSVQSVGTLHPGTEAYKSPEQRESGEHLTPASDIYTLGMVLFEMLTGRVYRNLRPGTQAQALGAGVPDWVKALVLRCLADAPEARPWDGAEFLEVLAAAEAEEQERQRAAAAEAARKQREREAAAAEAARKQREAEEQERQRAAAAEAARKQREAEERERQRAAAAEAARKQREKEAAAAEAARKQREAEERERQRAAAAEAARKQREAEEAARRAKATLVLAPGVEMAFVEVPAGPFLMGSDPAKDKGAGGDEQPQRKVTLDGYRIGKTPVTNAQYAAFVAATGHRAPEHWKGGRIPEGKADHPVFYVSWEDATAFCAWASGLGQGEVRLPTEAEWEKAARGTDGRIYPWGDQAPTAERCNFALNVKDTTAVGRYSPAGDSPYGCVDMAGNVWEWCADWYDVDYYRHAPDRNPQGPGTGVNRVLRGGYWNFNSDLLRVAIRSNINPTFRYYVGIRCAGGAPGN